MLAYRLLKSIQIIFRLLRTQWVYFCSYQTFFCQKDQSVLYITLHLPPPCPRPGPHFNPANPKSESFGTFPNPTTATQACPLPPSQHATSSLCSAVTTKHCPPIVLILDSRVRLELLQKPEPKSRLRLLLSRAAEAHACFFLKTSATQSALILCARLLHGVWPLFEAVLSTFISSRYHSMGRHLLGYLSILMAATSVWCRRLLIFSTCVVSSWHTVPAQPRSQHMSQAQVSFFLR